jgi:hypothetical protein
MFRINYFVLATAVLVFTANTVDAAGTAAPAPTTKSALVTLERSAYEAWKSKHAKFWDAFLSDKFVGWGSSGRLDKASATEEYTGADCDIKSYALSEEQMSPLGQDAALLTHKLTVDGTCAGQKIPATMWAAGVYVREGATWKGAFHAEAAIVDPRAAPAISIDEKAARGNDKAEPAHRDARTEAMLAVEKAVWEAWKEHDARKIAALTAGHISFINIFGVHLATKADALKNWSGTGCEVKSVSVADAAGTMLSPTVGILTFKATADGTCYGQRVGPVWGTSVYVRAGDVWKWNFGINLPARRAGNQP